VKAPADSDATQPALSAWESDRSGPLAALTWASGAPLHPDLAWAYDFPTRQLSPIAGLIAFYNEKVDIFLGGQKLERPKTHFFPPGDER